MSKISAKGTNNDLRTLRRPEDVLCCVRKRVYETLNCSAIGLRTFMKHYFCKQSYQTARHTIYSSGENTMTCQTVKMPRVRKSSAPKFISWILRLIFFLSLASKKSLTGLGLERLARILQYIRKFRQEILSWLRQLESFSEADSWKTKSYGYADPQLSNQFCKEISALILPTLSP